MEKTRPRDILVDFVQRKQCADEITQETLNRVLADAGSPESAPFGELCEALLTDMETPKLRETVEKLYWFEKLFPCLDAFSIKWDVVRQHFTALELEVAHEKNAYVLVHVLFDVYENKDMIMPVLNSIDRFTERRNKTGKAYAIVYLRLAAKDLEYMTFNSVIALFSRESMEVEDLEFASFDVSGGLVEKHPLFKPDDVPEGIDYYFTESIRNQAARFETSGANRQMEFYDRDGFFRLLN